MIEINLLPGANAPSLRSAANMNVSQALAQISDRFKDMYLFVAIIAVMGCVGGSFYMYRSQEQRRVELNDRERRAVMDSARFATVLRARRAAEAERDSIYRQVAIIKSIDDHRYLWSHLLEEVSRSLPAYTWLTVVEQTSTPPNPAVADVEVQPKKGPPDTTKAGKAKAKARADSILLAAQSGVKFRVEGQTVDVQALTQFMRSLEASPFIKNVQLMRSDLALVDGKEVTQFQLTAESETPPPLYTKMIPVTLGAN
jgi:Tfp pilus assembly protein PilN